METHKENGLISILESFKGVREISDEHLKMKELDRQFHHMAKELLYGGYFLIEGKTRICLDDIEFYYHEEGDVGLKDPIMYHTNDHEGKILSYFELGRLNLHVSGVDVTFENPSKQYRASFLIRGFHVEIDEVEKPYDPYSTHIYDKMLYMGLPLGKPIEIEWVTKNLQDKDCCNPIVGKRYNVPAEEHFIKNAKNKYEKKPLNEKMSIPLNKKEFFSDSAGRIYRRCTRQWRFYKVGLNILNE